MAQQPINITSLYIQYFIAFMWLQGRALSRQKGKGHSPFPLERIQVVPYFFTGSSGLLSLPAMKGLQGLALTGPGVFQTTLN